MQLSVLWQGFQNLRPLPASSPRNRQSIWHFWRVLNYICIVLYRIASYRIASHRIASHRIAAHRIVSYRIVSYRIVSYRIVSYRIVSYRIVSYRIVLYCIVLCFWICTRQQVCTFQIKTKARTLPQFAYTTGVDTIHSTVRTTFQRMANTRILSAYACVRFTAIVIKLIMQNCVKLQ